MNKQRVLQIVLGSGIIVIGTAFWLFPDDPQPQGVSAKEENPKSESIIETTSDIVAQNQTAPKLEPGEVLGEMPVDPNINIKTNKKRLIPEQPTVKTEFKPDNQQPQPKEPVSQQERQEKFQSVEEKPKQTAHEMKSERVPQPKPQKTITEDQLKSEEPQPKQQEIPEKEDDDSEIKALIDHIQKLEAERDAAKQEKQNIAAAKKERESQQKELDLLKKQISQLEKATTTKDKTNKLLKEQLAKLEELAAKKEPVKVTNNHITLNIQPVNDLEDNSALEEFLTDDEKSDIVADLNDLEDGETLEITDEDAAIIFVFTKTGDNIEVEQSTNDEDEQESEDEEEDTTEDQEIEEDAVIDSPNI